MATIQKVGDDMESLGRLFEAIINGMKQEFVVYGHTFSWWQVFVFTIVAFIVADIIGGIIGE